MSLLSSRTARGTSGHVKGVAATPELRQRPRRILIANGKGGCGKTTVATNLAGYYASNNIGTALLDYDPQGSSIQWLKARRDTACSPIHGVEAHRRAGARVTRTFQLRLPQNTQRVILDAPAGVQGLELVDMLRDVDAVLIPVLPSAIDTRAVSRFIEELLLVGKVRARSIRVGVVANRVREDSPVYEALERFLRSLRLPFVTRLRETEDYAVAADKGCSIHEIAGRHDAEHDSEQWQALIDWLEEGFRAR